MTEERRHAIHSRQFMQWLERAGVITGNASRVVIDAQVGQAVRIYVQQFGTEALIDVQVPPDLINAEVVIK